MLGNEGRYTSTKLKAFAAKWVAVAAITADKLNSRMSDEMRRRRDRSQLKADAAKKKNIVGNKARSNTGPAGR